MKWVKQCTRTQMYWWWPELKAETGNIFELLIVPLYAGIPKKYVDCRLEHVKVKMPCARRLGM